MPRPGVARIERSWLGPEATRTGVARIEGAWRGRGQGAVLLVGDSGVVETCGVLVGEGLLHEDAVAVLERWDAPDVEQEGLRAHYLRYLAQHADAVWRSSRPEHITASALVVDAAGSRVLLTLHKTVGRWLQLGGHCEPGDVTLAGAALRESTEESGLNDLTVAPKPLQLSRHEILAGGCASTFHLDVQFLVTATAGTEYVVSDESDDLAWFPIDTLPTDLDPSVQDLITRARQHLATQAPA